MNASLPSATTGGATSEKKFTVQHPLNRRKQRLVSEAGGAMRQCPQRVLMTTDTVGGVWTYALDLCRGLVAEGVDVMLASMGAPVRPEQRAAVAALGPRLQLRESTWKLEWMDDPWSDVAAAGEWLLRLAAEFCPDVVHLNGYVHADLRWDAPVLVVAHSCVYSWWRAVKHASPPPSWRRYHAAVSEGLRAADLVVAPSQAMLETLHANYGAYPASARVIHNGRWPASAAPSEDASEAPAKRPQILSVGRLWDEAKNAVTLAGVASGLPWPVRVAGDTRGPDGAVRQLSNVELLGVRSPPQLAAEYAQAAIYALPARYEPFGLSVLEAAQAGCALVLGDIPSLRELWDGAAVFVPPNDPHTLRVRLVDLIHQHDRRTELAHAASVRARRFSPHRMIDGYLSAYAGLLAPVATPHDGPRALSA